MVRKIVFALFLTLGLSAIVNVASALPPFPCPTCQLR